MKTGLLAAAGQNYSRILSAAVRDHAHADAALPEPILLLILVVPGLAATTKPVR